jgi:hypothetical protein
VSTIAKELGQPAGTRNRGLRQPPAGSARELADVERLIAHLREPSSVDESWIARNDELWCRVTLRATAEYAKRLVGLARDRLAADLNGLSVGQIKHYLVERAEAARLSARQDGQRSAEVAAIRAQADWLLPRQDAPSEQHVHLHFAAALDAVEARHRAARALAAGFPPLLPLPTQDVVGDGMPDDSHKSVPPQGQT